MTVLCLREAFAGCGAPSPRTCQTCGDGPCNQIKFKYVKVRRSRNGWYVASIHATTLFPHSGYLRKDGTWGISMVQADGKTGYFESETEAKEALAKVGT